MTKRRAFLRSLLLGMCAVPAAPLFGSAAPAAPALRRLPEFVIVDGWVLTRADLARLDAHAR